MYILSAEEELCAEIVGCAYWVHRKLGPGLLEKVYEACFCYELSKRNIPYKRQLKIPIYYDGLEFDEGLQLDVMVADRIICELKAVSVVNPLWQAQLLSYLKLTQKNVGFVINFNTALAKEGIRRYCIS